MTPRDSFTAMNQYRLTLLCMLHGSETPEGVPADKRAAFDELVEYHNQDRARLFDTICRDDFGAVFFEDISPESQAEALRELEHTAATFANSCRCELEFLRIEQEEALEQAFDEEIA
ncbi:hypothetical protein JQ574_28955 [Bradyrhizobium sp. AUGA SZCCT0158]|uniref:hypothetical protein n=1 Tax=Bradyrhizobium sp. AUGA SZCCT0158 TaxID=2807661 RepID=UPI001BABDD9E|nr:hypothetical protein [Bradyrhizobium sp. AUGA SZCCT0158]MBR1200027.1 hypothetical protein [Bradyrhizobium sp. AUGA SZCCT0158]